MPQPIIIGLFFQAQDAFPVTELTACADINCPLCHPVETGAWGTGAEMLLLWLLLLL